MAWEEWEQLKAAAAERHDVGMRLDQLPADQGSTASSGGGASGRLRSDKAAWSRAGGDVATLRDDTGKVLKKLGDGQTGLGKDAGVRTAAAQRGVHSSWKRRLERIHELCDGLAEVLEKTGNDQLRTDQAIEEAIAGLSVGAEKTPTADGPAKDR